MAKADRLWLRGHIWWCWGLDAHGNRWQESTHQRDKGAAKLAQREIERLFAADPGWKARGRLTVEVALELVLKFQQTGNRAEATVRASTYHARHLIEILGATKPLASVTLADTTRYLTKRLEQGAHRHTISKELRMLTQAMHRAEKLGHYRPERSPAHYIPDELGTVYEPRERWLTRAEYETLLAELANRYRESDQDRSDYVIAWCSLGLRKSELFDIQPGDYDSVAGKLRVRGTKTEAADRMVPVNADAAKVLERRCGQRVPFPVWHTVTRDLARACERAGIAPVTPNDLRRTFCSWLCQAGVPERVCAELMGHESTVMVRAVYGHLDHDSMASAVSRIQTPVAGAVAAEEPEAAPKGQQETGETQDFTLN